MGRNNYNEEVYVRHRRIYEHFFHTTGGVRHRVFGTDVCINKFPFFRFDFTPIEIGPGYHFFRLNKKRIVRSKHIRLARTPGVLMHIKFIKPSIGEFIQSRIEKNQDWDNSYEYKCYQRVLKKRNEIKFINKKFSRRLKSCNDLVRFFKVD